ncbi:conjugal transfer protein, partial [Pseudomonas tremae]
MKKSILTLVLLQGLQGCGHTPPSTPSTPSDTPAPLESYLAPADPPSADVTESRRQLLEESGRNTGFRGGKAERA